LAKKSIIALATSVFLGSLYSKKNQKNARNLNIIEYIIGVTILNLDNQEIFLRINKILKDMNDKIPNNIHINFQ